jgi:hypothetical protein
MRANGSHAPLTTTIDIHDKEGRKIGQKEVATYAGILALAHDDGLRSIVTKLIQMPTKENGSMVIVTAVVRTNRGVFTAIGDANPGNVNRRIAAHIIRMAETRAKARALRDAVNIGTVALEELGELVEEELSSEPGAQFTRSAGSANPIPPSARPANDNAAAPVGESNLPTVSEQAFQAMSEAQRRLLFRIAGERGIAPENAQAWLLSIRCTDPVWKGGVEGGNLVGWKRIPNHSAGACFSGGGSAGGMVKGPTSLANSTGSRRARVAAQYFGASSR